MKKIFIFGLLFLFFACPKEETEVEPIDVVDLVPGDGEISDWVWNSPMKIFESYSQLYAEIDGGADIYFTKPLLK